MNMNVNMNIELRFNIESGDISSKIYKEEFEDIISIIFYICEEIDGAAEFYVEGFGQSPWPVDVSTDLPVFLLQVPDIITAISSGDVAQADFYEQGIQRKIDFNLVGSKYSCKCSSQTEWQPSPEVEFVEQKKLLGMLIKLKDNFLMITENVAPEFLENTLFKEWSNDLRHIVCKSLAD